MNAHSIQEQYRKSVFLKILFIVALLQCTVILAIIGCGAGPIQFEIPQIVKALANGLFGFSFAVPDNAVMVITSIRLPRIVLAILSGFGLSIAGMQMQVVLRNPLASPLTLGVSSGAALGAGLAILAGFSLIGGRYMLIANAFIFSLLPCVVIFVISRAGITGHGMLILAGVAMNFIFSSISTLLTYFSNSEELKSLSLWMMGNLGRATWNDIAVLFTVLIVTMPLLFLQNQKLNTLNTGDESASGLGLNVEKTRLTVLILTAVVSSSITCFTGIIGFVGLVAPHIVRMIIGNDARYLMPASGFFGAAFLLGADIVSVKIIEPAVLPVGIITSFVGGPLLLWLIIRKQGQRTW
ncbi:MAG: iron ABC transporter permease [Chitinispirillaceae bacterium]|nr:iron ABC transporter permease [Chitinispirillaceae bacterium]